MEGCSGACPRWHGCFSDQFIVRRLLKARPVLKAMTNSRRHPQARLRQPLPGRPGRRQLLPFWGQPVKHPTRLCVPSSRSCPAAVLLKGLIPDHSRSSLQGLNQHSLHLNLRSVDRSCGQGVDHVARMRAFASLFRKVLHNASGG